MQAAIYDVCGLRMRRRGSALPDVATYCRVILSDVTTCPKTGSFKPSINPAADHDQGLVREPAKREPAPRTAPSSGVPVQPIPRISQTGPDVAVLVEPAIDAGAVDHHVGVVGVHRARCPRAPRSARAGAPRARRPPCRRGSSGSPSRRWRASGRAAARRRRRSRTGAWRSRAPRRASPRPGRRRGSRHARRGSSAEHRVEHAEPGAQHRHDGDPRRRDAHAGRPLERRLDLAGLASRACGSPRSRRAARARRTSRRKSRVSVVVSRSSVSLWRTSGCATSTKCESGDIDTG